MSTWSTDDVREFIRHRGYPAQLGDLLKTHKVDGRGLLRLVKDPQLLSSLGLHPLRAQGLRNDIIDYKSSGTFVMTLVLLILREIH